MNQRIHQFLSNDHRRIEDILARATAEPGNYQMELYHAFRIGLLTHIKMEEKVLFPAAQKANGGVQLEAFAQLRLEHGAITTLMVPPPTPALVKVLRYILDKHDLLEEKPGGMYDVCERLTEAQTDDLLLQMKNIGEVPVHPHNEAAYALETAIRSVQRAGYDYDQIAKN